MSIRLCAMQNGMVVLQRIWCSLLPVHRGHGDGVSLAKYEQPDGKLYQQMMPQMMQRILRRAALLVLLGVLLNASSLVLDGVLNGKPIDLGTLRLPGVLQRIGLAYLLASIVLLRVPKTERWTLAEIALAGYWGLMVLVPVPGHGDG
ncbi:hypothetical protein HC928_06855, partial [bacterium]|nr:hypothetical protein [bacterium]